MRYIKAVRTQIDLENEIFEKYTHSMRLKGRFNKDIYEESEVLEIISKAYGIPYKKVEAIIKRKKDEKGISSHRC